MSGNGSHATNEVNTSGGEASKEASKGETTEEDPAPGDQPKPPKNKRTYKPLHSEGVHAFYYDLIHDDPEPEPGKKLGATQCDLRDQSQAGYEDLCDEQNAKVVIDSRKPGEPGFLGVMDKSRPIVFEGQVGATRAKLGGRNRALFDRLAFGRTSRIRQAVLTFMWVSGCTMICLVMLMMSGVGFDVM